MFYLEHILNIFKRSFFLGLSFILFGAVLFNFIAFKPQIEGKINHFVASKISKPHFFGLIDNKINVESVRRKLVDLPGIEGVATVDDGKIKAKVENIISGLDESLTAEDLKLSYSGLKIIFSPEVRAKGQNLLRNYLVRLVGGENVILGPVLSTSRQDNTTSKLIKSWGYFFVLLSLVVFWLMITGQFIYKVFFESKVIEKFKRTQFVAEKTCLILMAFMCLLIIIPQVFIMGNIQMMSLVAFTISMSIMMLLFNARKWI